MSIVSDKLREWKEHCRSVQDANPVDIHEPVEQQHVRKERAKKDFQFFVDTYFKHYVTAPLAPFQLKDARAVLNDPNFFGVMEYPREHAKSVIYDIFEPLWLKINGELDGMILVGKNFDDASGLLSDVQAELQYNPLFIHDWGVQVTAGSWEEGDFITSDGIEFIAVGRGQSPRGIRNREKRPNYCVIDDIDDDEIVQNPDRVGRTVEWILGSLYGALAIKRARLVMVGNRIHKHSILANIVGDVEPDQPKRKGIYHSRILAIMDGRPVWRYTMAELQLKFDRMGYYLSQREYFHNPIVKGKIFKSEWIVWGAVPPLGQMDFIICYFDPSYKPKTTNDFKAIRVWGAKGFRRYLIKSFARQCTITEAVKWLYDYHESTRDRCNINYYMEEVFLQGMFFDDFEAEAKLRGYYLPISGDKRKKIDKFSRIQSLAPLYERGTIIYNEAERKDPGMQTGLEQVLGFQKGSTVHDDVPDADEGALFILQKYGRQQATEPVIGTRHKAGGW